MSVDTRARRGVHTWLALGCVVVLLLTAGLWLVLRDAGGTRLTAYFDRTVGLYPGSSVRVLGIDVGEITAVTPEGGAVRVDLRVDQGVPVPADAGAVVVAPSLVSDRYVQLTPAYEDGPALRSGAVIPLERTATPAEIDDLYGSLNELSTSLGPDGANAGGALSRALDAAAANLEGNGRNLGDTVRRLGELSRTLDGAKGDLFATVRNLQSFTSMLAESDQQLDEFYRRLADVAGFLAEDSDDVGAALSALGTALTDVQGFVEENRDLLSSNVDKLAGITGVLVDQRAALAEVLDVGPTGMTNFINSYDAASGSIQIRYNANELTHPLLTTLCRLVRAATPEQLPDALRPLCETIAQVESGVLKVPSLSQMLASMQRGDLPPLPLPLADVLTRDFDGGGR
ncbi:virulence factor Mce family protein [Amycolatopsis arida]|uniref:Virulence factor Mce family protein n=1 Tax=Amycolatopsis arida TaxID=587909 RepID=A0A1I5XL86_9PSEU|nr:MCE family protein [Amycolatopsis arida]TDX97383.1 virulence factor Mce-like protein [Amycolatopsis arida]SFQ32576.1 virulence factor Mce family protein [Amycolatopsis arida]